METSSNIIAAGRFYGGTSGLVLPVPNKQHYPDEYRERSRLCYYGSLFNTIEINSSFYKIPMAKTVARWADDVPDGFKFTFKLWKAITHNKLLVFDQSDVYRFMDVIAQAGNRKGCLLIQFPASITSEYMKPFRSLLQMVLKANKRDGWPISIEFRHASWYEKKNLRWLQQRQINVVSHDIPPVTPFVDSGTEWVYLRFHGPEKGYRGSYADEVLQKYADHIHAFLGQGKAVYAYFNNTLGNAVGNLQTLKRMVMNVD